MGETNPAIRLNQSLHYQFIDRAEQLPPLFAALDRCTEIALDTEADNLFRYRTRVCLLQIHAVEEIYLVDLLPDLPPAAILPRPPAADPRRRGNLSRGPARRSPAGGTLAAARGEAPDHARQRLRSAPAVG